MVQLPVKVRLKRGLLQALALTRSSRRPHERLQGMAAAVCLLFGPRHGERTEVAHVVRGDLQQSERWMCEMRDASIRPLKGSATPPACRPVPRDCSTIALTAPPAATKPAAQADVAEAMMRISKHWRSSPKLRHPYPDWRFDVITRGGGPSALAAHAGICAGGGEQSPSLPRQLLFQ
jgi:hypothetical protein